ncbi:unnamed protein product, partial [Effrenium voratum]
TALACCVQIREQKTCSHGPLDRGALAGRCCAGAGWVAPCSGSSMLRAVRDLAPACIAECPDLCAQLNQLILTALMGVNPLPQVCGNFETFVCMDTPACNSLLDRAESYDLFHVPRSETELSEACGIPVTTTAAKVDVAAATPTDVTEDDGAGSTNSSGNATSNPSTTAALGAADSTSTPTAVASTTSSPGLRTTQPAGTSENSTTTADGFHDALIYNFAHRHASLSWVYPVILLVAYTMA